MPLVVHEKGGLAKALRNLELRGLSLVKSRFSVKKDRAVSLLFNKIAAIFA